MDIYKSALDFRTIDLKKSAHKEYVDGMIARHIQQGKDELIKRIEVFDKCVKYYESEQTPSTISDDGLSKFVESNSDGLIRTSDNYIYFQDNRIKEVIDNRVGEYQSVKKVIQVKSDTNPRNDRIEHAYKRYIEKIEQKQKLWKIARMPAIADMSIYGVGWTNLFYNPYKDLPYGRIEMSNVSPREVLLDIHSKLEFFADRRHHVRMITMDLEEAKKYLYELAGVNPDDVHADEDTREYDSERDTPEFKDETATIYIYECKRTYTDTFGIPEQNVLKFQIDKKSEGKPEGNLMRHEKDYYFYAVYVNQLGCVYWWTNPYEQFFITPYYNKRSRLGLYPRSDVEDLIKIQDLINITKSLVLDNARQKNLVRAIVNQKMKDSYGDLWDDFVRFGGQLPVDDIEDVGKAVKFLEIPDLPRSVYDFMGIVEKSMEEQSQMYEPQKGQYPKERLSGRAIGMLDEKARRKYNYKDEHIEYAGESEADLIYKMIGMNFTAEDFLEVTDAKKNEPNTIAVNSIMTLAQYENFLKHTGLMSEEEIEMLNSIEVTDPQYFTKKFEVLKPVMKKFEKHNEVEIQYLQDKRTGHFIDEKGNVVPPLEVWNNRSLVFINQFLDEKMNVKISLKFDDERDEENDKYYALLFLEKFGEPFLEEALEVAGGMYRDRKEEIIEKVTKHNQAMALMEEFEQRGDDFDKAFIKFLQLYDKSKAEAMSQKKNVPTPS